MLERNVMECLHFENILGNNFDQTFDEKNWGGWLGVTSSKAIGTIIFSKSIQLKVSYEM